jgi:hypothetical protein
VRVIFIPIILLVTHFKYVNCKFNSKFLSEFLNKDFKYIIFKTL